MLKANNNYLKLNNNYLFAKIASEKKKYLEKCMKSIFDNIENSFEVILINDGSKDNSLKIIKELMKKYKNIMCYSFSLSATPARYLRRSASEWRISRPKGVVWYSLRLLSGPGTGVMSPCDWRFSRAPYIVPAATRTFPELRFSIFCMTAYPCPGTSSAVNI